MRMAISGRFGMSVTGAGCYDGSLAAASALPSVAAFAMQEKSWPTLKKPAFLISATPMCP
jgi:hypothetical protein